jgi:hypothetical protein
MILSALAVLKKHAEAAEIWLTQEKRAKTRDLTGNEPVFRCLHPPYWIFRHGQLLKKRELD